VKKSRAARKRKTVVRVFVCDAGENGRPRSPDGTRHEVVTRGRDPDGGPNARYLCGANARFRTMVRIDQLGAAVRLVARRARDRSKTGARPFAASLEPRAKHKTTRGRFISRRVRRTTPPNRARTSSRSPISVFIIFPPASYVRGVSARI